MRTLALIAVVVVLAAVCPVHGQQPRPLQPVQPAVRPGVADAAALTIQFDNKKSTVTDSRKTKDIINALATNVFNVPPQQVTVQSGVDQSTLAGVLGSQSVVTFRAVGPTTNRKTVLANCETNTKGFLFFDSPAQKAVKKATDTWFPGDSVKVQKATCAKA